jgi:hypothetical protein
MVKDKKEHICIRCGKVFTKKFHLLRHQNGKTQCKFLRLDEDETDTPAFAIETDDLILNKEIQFEELPEFNFMEKLEPDQTYSMLIAAIRRSGKTTMIRYIYPFLAQTYDIVLFISNSIHNPVYNFVTGPRFPCHNPQMFKDILKLQRRTGNLFRICVILDDCISIGKKDDDALLQFFIRGRNSNVTILLSSQSTKMINKNNRMNTDFIIIGNNPSAEAREDVLKSFLLGAVPIPKFIKTKSQKVDYLNKYLLHHTKDKGFLIMDNVKGGIFKFRTPLSAL